MAIPGPVEPSLEEMNNIMDIFIKDMHELRKGTLSLYEVTPRADYLSYRARIQGSWPYSQENCALSPSSQHVRSSCPS
jgi:hypothetical protein